MLGKGSLKCVRIRDLASFGPGQPEMSYFWEQSWRPDGRLASGFSRELYLCPFLIFFFFFNGQSTLRPVSPCLCPQGHEPVLPFGVCMDTT